MFVLTAWEVGVIAATGTGAVLMVGWTTHCYLKLIDRRVIDALSQIREARKHDLDDADWWKQDKPSGGG